MTRSREIAMQIPEASAPVPAGADSPTARRVAAWILAGLCVLIALARLHTYNEPTDRDTGAYGVMAHEMLNGKRLYDGVLLDQKPPAIHFTYAVAEVLAGYGRAQVYLLAVVAGVAMLIGVYFAGKELGGGCEGGLWAAAFWTVAGGDLALEANQPNSEAFINAWTVFGLLFLFGKVRGMIPWRQAVLAGVCFAAASLYKHVVVVVPLFAGLAYIACPRPGRSRREALWDVVIVGLVGVLAWAGLFAYFGATGRFGGVIDCLFKYNQYYSGDKGHNMALMVRPHLLFPPPLYNLIPLALLSVGGIVAGLLWKRESYPWVALAGLAVGTAFAVALPGRFFAHYYQLWFPFLILGAAAAAGFIGKNFRHLRLARLVAPAALVALVANELPYYFLSAKEWSAEKYGPVFVETDLVARELRVLLKPGETFFQFGEEPELYFDTGTRPESTFCIDGVFSGPLASQLARRTVSDLLGHPPDLLLVGERIVLNIPPQFPLWVWIKAHYTFFGPPPGRTIYFCARKGSALEKRMKPE